MEAQILRVTFTQQKYPNYFAVHTAAESGFANRQKNVFVPPSKGGANKNMYT